MPNKRKFTPMRAKSSAKNHSNLKGICTSPSCKVRSPMFSEEANVKGGTRQVTIENNICRILLAPNTKHISELVIGRAGKLTKPCSMSANPVQQGCQISHPNWVRLALNGTNLGTF